MRNIASMSLKRAALVVCGALLAAALPAAAAFAIDGSSAEIVKKTSTATSTLGGITVTMTMTGDIQKADTTRDWELVTGATTTQASGVASAPANSKLIANFEAYPVWVDTGKNDDELWAIATKYTYAFSFALDTHEYDGKTVIVYVDHHDGSTEALKSTITNGTFNIISGLSIYSLVIDLDSSGANQNTSSVSPQTGVFDATAGIGALGIAAILGAGVLAFSLRSRKVR